MNVDFERIMQNLKGAFAQLMALRLIVSSPSRKVADVPAAYALLCAVLAPWVCVFMVAVGFLFRYGARFEKDATKM